MEVIGESSQVEVDSMFFYCYGFLFLYAKVIYMYNTRKIV